MSGNFFLIHSTKVWKEWKPWLKCDTHVATNIHKYSCIWTYRRNSGTQSNQETRHSIGDKYFAHTFVAEKDNKAKMRTKSFFVERVSMRSSAKTWYIANIYAHIELEIFIVSTTTTTTNKKIETRKCRFDSGFTLNKTFGSYFICMLRLISLSLLSHLLASYRLPIKMKKKPFTLSNTIKKIHIRWNCVCVKFSAKPQVHEERHKSSPL